MKKKLFAAGIFVALICLAVGIAAADSYTVTEGNLTYTVDPSSGVASVIQCDDNVTITVQSKDKGYKGTFKVKVK